jgi:type IV secretion system protein VirD4
LVVVVLATAVVVVAAVWLGAWSATVLVGRRFDGEVTDGLRVAIGYLAKPGRPPAAVWGDRDVPGPWLVYPLTATWLGVLAGGAGGVARVIGGPEGGFVGRRRLGVDPASRFARRGELASLWLRCPVPGRFVLGRAGGRTLASTNPRYPTAGLTWWDRVRRWVGRRRGPAEAFGGILLVGLSQTGKSQHALTALRALSAAGCPMICSSVKGDIIEELLAQRRRVGQVGIFDPTGTLTATYESRRTAGLRVPAGWDARLCVGWSPLDGVVTFDHAVAAAHRLAESGPGMDQVTGGDFWREQAEMLIAPLLWVAARCGLDMGEVTLWVLSEDRPEPAPDDQAMGGYVPEPVRLLEPLFEDLDPVVRRDAVKASQVLHGLWDKADTTVGSVYATANTILRPWATEQGRHSSTGNLVNLDWLLGGSGQNTLAISAPPQEQRQLRPVLTGAVSSILDAVYRHTQLHGPLDPPLVVFLDEIGNAPLARLPEYLSTLASAGVLLITVWQDVSQVRKAYGDHAGSILSNSRHVLLFGGSKDTATLDWVRQVVGDEAADTTSVTRNLGEMLAGSASSSQQLVPLTPGNVLRQMPKGQALLISANNPPIAVRHLPEHSIRAFRPLRRWPYPDDCPLGLPIPLPTHRIHDIEGPTDHGAIHRAEQRYSARLLAAVFDTFPARLTARLSPPRPPDRLPDLGPDEGDWSTSDHPDAWTDGEAWDDRGDEIPGGEPFVFDDRPDRTPDDPPSRSGRWDSRGGANRAWTEPAGNDAACSRLHADHRAGPDRRVQPGRGRDGGWSSDVSGLMGVEQSVGGQQAEPTSRDRTGREPAGPADSDAVVDTAGIENLL